MGIHTIDRAVACGWARGAAAPPPGNYSKNIFSVDFPGNLRVATKTPVRLGRIFFPIDHHRGIFCNREQSDTNRNDENAVYDYLSECLQRVSKYMKIHHDRFCIFYGHFANESR